jgi:hypothetical protein
MHVIGYVDHTNLLSVQPRQVKQTILAVLVLGVRSQLVASFRLDFTKKSTTGFMSQPDATFRSTFVSLAFS